ncbi:radical SAM protein, partial [Candidatus Sumerlaeota bacterium]|nr:radical SAM protein [Candidatus Sumerlaeota bacterium]
QFLKAIQSLEGVEVTEGACQRFGLESSPTPVRPHVAEALDAADAYSAITTPMTELGDRCLVEIARGCPYRCRFCFTGHTIAYRPRPFEAVREMIERGRRLTQRFGLIAPAVGSHPDIGRICEWCQSERLEVSFSSLRVEDVSPAMLDLIAAGGQQSATIAPEAGTERLRRYLGKKVTDDQVVAFAANAVARGLTDLRLYFMVGLPTEQAEDIEAIGRLVAATKRAAMAARPRAQAQIRIAVNAAIFVPKPGAPLAEQPRPPAAQVKKHLQRLSKSLGAIGGVELRAPSIAEAESQRVLSWGGREVFQALLKTAQTGGTWRHFLTEAAKSHDTEPRRHKDTKKVQR